MSADEVRLIAFYLPQYHPIPENDGWWGKGFTEWTNVARAQPLFRGHYQPHVPADLGFCDLRLAETRLAQAELARAHGIHGFCYYHYWFHGDRLLERPFNEILHSGAPLPFCLCWANESWTKAWDCRPDNVIKAQRYSTEDDRNHLRWLAAAFRDPRYIRINGRPLFLVYRAHDLPDAARTAAVWRDEAKKEGAGDPFLCKVECYDDPRKDPADYGFDAAVEFQPNDRVLFTQMSPLQRGWRWDLRRRLGLAERAYADNAVFAYADVVERMLGQPDPPYKRLPGITPNFDNSSRHKKEAVILSGSTPALYKKWLAGVIDRARRLEAGERVIFVNAWNEWAEGNHLEPDLLHGRGYLEATRQALAEARQQPVPVRRPERQPVSQR